MSKTLQDFFMIISEKVQFFSKAKLKYKKELQSTRKNITEKVREELNFF